MYHHVSPDKSIGLMISVDKLEAQIDYLVKNGYSACHFKELINHKDVLLNNDVVITFDDVYVNQMEFLIHY